MNMKHGSRARGATKPGGQARHPSHPPLTDVTIGAYTFATSAVVLSKLGVAEHGFAQAWWLALVVGAASSVLTELTGLLEWLRIPSGTRLKRKATLHAGTMPAASVFFVLAIAVGHDDYVARSIGTSGLALTLVGFALLTVGGAIGGSLVYVDGVRVENREHAATPPGLDRDPQSELART